MVTASVIQRYASSPAAFIADLRISSAVGIVKFKEVISPHQQDWIKALAPSVLAVARGERPKVTRHWIEGTKGSGKDGILSMIVLWSLAFSPRPLRIQVGAADKDQAGELHRAASDILRFNPWLAQRVEAQSSLLTCEATGAEAEIVASDTSGSHGSRPDIVILNELSHVTKWEFVENLADNASKMPNGILIVATNAGSTGSEAWKWRELARGSERWSFHIFDKPAPWLDKAELDEAERRNSTARYRRLFWGVWSSGAGDALDEADIQAAVKPDLRPLDSSDSYSNGSVKKVRDPRLPRLELVVEEDEQQTTVTRPTNRFSFIAGLDLGIKRDHSALVILAANHEAQRIQLASSQHWAPNKTTGQIDLEEVEAAVVDAYSRFRFTALYYDPFQAQLMAQRLNRRNIRAVEMPFTGNNLNKMATTLLEVFRSRRIDLYPDERLTGQLRRLTIEEKSYGHRLTAVHDADGHCDDATALAIALPATLELCNGPGGTIVCDFDPFQILDTQPHSAGMYVNERDERDSPTFF